MATEIDEEYLMDHPHRGLCLIFNHEKFTHCDRRFATDFDAYRLRGCFEKLGFTYKVHKDLYVDELEKVLNQVASYDYSDNDCFVCCFLTHGDEHSLHAKDITYAKRDVFARFTSDKCPSLKGKPKIFFIQACRGEKCDECVSPGYQNNDALKIVEPINLEEPIWADFLMAYSTVEGFDSYRHNFLGGPFIQNLTPNLEKYGTEYDLVSILTLVNKKVGAAEPGKQSPQFVSTLTKKVIFREKPNQRMIPSTMSYHNELLNQNNGQCASNCPEEE